MPTTAPSCRPITNSMSAGRSVRNGTSVEPGLPKIRVMPWRRITSNVASRTVSMGGIRSHPGPICCSPVSQVATTKSAPPPYLIWALGALSMFGPLSSDMYLPGLPQLTHGLHASASAGQLTLTASVLGIALGQLFAGPVSDARGRRLPLLVGLVGFTVTSGLCAISPSIWFLIAVRFIQGVAGGTGIVIARAIV